MFLKLIQIIDPQKSVWHTDIKIKNVNATNQKVTDL